MLKATLINISNYENEEENEKDDDNLDQKGTTADKTKKEPRSAESLFKLRMELIQEIKEFPRSWKNTVH